MLSLFTVPDPREGLRLDRGLISQVSRKTPALPRDGRNRAVSDIHVNVNESTNRPSMYIFSRLGKRSERRFPVITPHRPSGLGLFVLKTLPVISLSRRWLSYIDCVDYRKSHVQDCASLWVHGYYWVVSSFAYYGRNYLIGHLCLAGKTPPLVKHLLV